MRNVEVTIREIDKGSNELTLLNIKDELVNFLYKETVANSTKADQQFYVLLFFIALKDKDGPTLLEKLLDEALPKFQNLNNALSNKKDRLKSGEYKQLVSEYGLRDIFQYDVFFILAEAILNLDEIRNRYADYFTNNPTLSKTLDILESRYFLLLNENLTAFKAAEIEDDRYDDQGNYHDLSKSVYRTIRMRNARNLDLNLQKYTSIKSVTSRSPIDFTFCQHVDAQILFDLWSKYHLAEYSQLILKDAVNGLRNNVQFNIDLGYVFTAWLIYRLTIKPKDRKEALQLFKETKEQNNNQKALIDLTQTLVDSILKANERLEKEVDSLKKQLKKARSSHIATQNEDLINKLEDRINKLENITVSAKLIDSEKSNFN